MNIAQRVGSWAASHMGPEELAEAREIERRFRRHTGRWVAVMAGIVLASAFLLRALEPSFGFGRVLLHVIVAFLWLLLVTLPPYFGYRMFAARPSRMMGTLLALAAAGAVVGFAIALIDDTEGWSGLALDAVWKALLMALVMGAAVAVITLAVSRVRLREAAERASRLAEENERERLARQTVQAELKLLQAQVEPHFLFNTLANVRHLVHCGSPEALSMLDHLIQYLRTALPDIRSESSTIGREAGLAGAYLEIMRMRMEALRFEIDIASDLAGHAFPPLMLMTLVENAVKHGAMPLGRGEVRIVARRSGDRIAVSVEDDGRGLAGAIGQGLGLANVRERLRALYGDDARLVVEGGASGGVVARLELPA